MSEKFKPCPFCGSNNIRSGDNWSCGYAYVLCNNCGGMISQCYSNEEEAIIAWNTRKKKI